MSAHMVHVRVRACMHVHVCVHVCVCVCVCVRVRVHVRVAREKKDLQAIAFFLGSKKTEKAAQLVRYVAPCV